MRNFFIFMILCLLFSYTISFFLFWFFCSQQPKCVFSTVIVKSWLNHQMAFSHVVILCNQSTWFEIQWHVVYDFSVDVVSFSYSNSYFTTWYYIIFNLSHGNEKVIWNTLLNVFMSMISFVMKFYWTKMLIDKTYSR